MHLLPRLVSYPDGLQHSATVPLQIEVSTVVVSDHVFSYVNIAPLINAQVGTSAPLAIALFYFILVLDLLHFVTLIEGVEAFLLVHFPHVGMHYPLVFCSLPLLLLLCNYPLLFLLVRCL